MTGDPIFDTCIIITICIVVFAIGYYIWFLCWWNKMERKKDEIMMRYRENQTKILIAMLSKDKKKDN